MSSSVEFVEYIAGQLAEAGTITYRKMFGEYGVYCDGKIFALICDNQLFIKITEAGRAFDETLVSEPPYEGAKPYFLVENIDDRGYLTELTRLTCRELPPSKPKRPKKA